MKKPFLAKTIGNIILIGLMLFAAGCAVNVNERMIVAPSKEINQQNFESLTNDIGYSEGRLTIGDSDESIFYLSKNSEDAEKTLLILHGNALNLTHQPWFGVLETLAELPVNIVAIDYRGFGLSSGDASFSNMKQDAHEVLSLFPQDQQLVVLGMSLGGALATDLAKDERIKGLILEGAVTNVDDMIKVYRERNLFGGMVDITLDDNIHFDSQAVLRESKKPILVIHGDADENIPYEMGEALYQASISPNKRIYLVEKGGHCDAFHVNKTRYLQEIGEFIETI